MHTLEPSGAEKRKAKLASDGCANCSGTEANTVYELPFGVICDSCHNVRSRVIQAILRQLSHEPLEELLKLKKFLEIRVDES